MASAVSGAHLTSTVDENRPSIFEVLAQDSLVSTLQPALKHALQVLAQRNPSRYGWLYVFSDELYSSLHLILEHHYLKRYSASFSENFYGLKRVLSKNVNKDGVSHSTALPLTNHLRSLLCLVLIPYIKRKADAMYERLHETRQQQTQPRSREGLQAKLIKAFLALYPVLHLAYEGTCLAFQMAYIFGKARVHSPLLRLAGVNLCNLSLEDMANHSAPAEPLVLRDKSWLQKISLLSNKALATLAVAVSSGLSVGVFFLQFLEWWYASDQHATSLTALPNPPPPQVQKHDRLPKLNSVCPLCQKMRTNDTALAITGYVFCYPCIYTYVRDHKSCPVTGYPAHMDHLVKLYLPSG